MRSLSPWLATNLELQAFLNIPEQLLARDGFIPIGFNTVKKSIHIFLFFFKSRLMSVFVPDINRHEVLG